MITDNNGKVLFTNDELSCNGSGRVYLHPEFAQKLKQLRIDFDMPMKVNSCCRSPEYNKEVGGHPKSMHLLEGGRVAGTCAIDIHCPNNYYKAKLGGLALQNGWSVGVYKTFLHLDLRSLAGFNQAMFWGGY